MKVLFVVPYLACSDIPIFNNDKGGFGYMVYDIAKSIAQKEQVDIYVSKYMYDSFKYDNINFISNTWCLIFRHIYKNHSLITLIRLVIKYKMSFHELLNTIYRWIQLGYLSNVIRNGGYDMIHCHGCDFYNTLYVKMFKKNNCKFIFTLHGLNSFSRTIHIEKSCKNYECDFLEEIIRENIPISVISSGIKKDIGNLYTDKNLDNVMVIGNAYSFPIKKNEREVDIFSKYSIPQNSKVLLYVGNISFNKNQQQMIESYNMIPDNLRCSLYILFIGMNIEPGYDVKMMASKSKESDHLIFCGSVDKSEMPSYYKQANGVALLSYEEGFGLSLIEGMSFGKPCIAHKDIYAFPDIFAPIAMIGIKDRTNLSVAQAVVELFSRKWSEDDIKKYASRFNINQMADNYIDYYKKVIYNGR